jgi:hypothetical protein
MMTKNTATIERRKYERFRLDVGGLALLTPGWPHSTIVGDILDISTGGIALRYVSGESPESEICEMGIACSSPRFYMGNLSARAISDFPMARIRFGSLLPRRLSLEFGPLTPDQTSHIEDYIKNHVPIMV